MMDVFLHVLGEDENVIQVGKDKPAEHITKKVIHQRLEECWGIGKAKRHHQVLEVAHGGVESH